MARELGVIWASFTLYEFESEIFSIKIYITFQHEYMHDFFDTDDKLHITRSWGCLFTAKVYICVQRSKVGRKNRRLHKTMKGFRQLNIYDSMRSHRKLTLLISKGAECTSRLVHSHPGLYQCPKSNSAFQENTNLRINRVGPIGSWSSTSNAF